MEEENDNTSNKNKGGRKAEEMPNTCLLNDHGHSLKAVMTNSDPKQLGP